MPICRSVLAHSLAAAESLSRCIPWPPGHTAKFDATTSGLELYYGARAREASWWCAHAAASGVPITAEQLVVQRRDIGAAGGATFEDPGALVGRVPSRALAPGVVPTENDLSLGAPLRRGDPVVLVSRTGGVEVRMPGRALGPAQTGGRIGVENVSSRRVLRGRLIAEGLVELLP